MIRFSDGFLSTIRDRISLSDIIGRKVSWDRRKSRPSKGDHWACCPFHAEKTPSFHVDDRRGRYHCFGCGASGDHFRFLMEHDGVSFPEAVEMLAGEAGVAMPAADPEAARRYDARLKLHDVLDLAATFFERNLHTPEGKHALAYALQRGLDDPIQKAFRIGLAPDSRNGLLAYLKSHNVPLADMVETGLVIEPEEAGRAPYDRFRGRLMVAIEDIKGKVVGFGGRVLGDGEPKYLNSPETDLFRKREMVFNAQRARQAAHRKDRLIVVEGYMDAIALHRAGFEEVVASLGTAMGEEQIGLMWRFADEPIVCFDGDGAGQGAAFRAMDRALPLLKPGKSLRFLFLPSGLDPDDFLQQQGSEAFENLLSTASPMVEALWEREHQQADVSTPERMAAFQSKLNRLVASIGDQTVRSLYDQALKDRFYAMRRAMRAVSRPDGRASTVRKGEPSEALQGVRARAAPVLKQPDYQLLALARRFPEDAQNFADRDVFALCADSDLAVQLDAALNGQALPPDQDKDALDTLPFPILQQQASPRFIGMLFAFLFAQLELRAIEADAQLRDDTGHDALDEDVMERFLAIQNEARAMRARIAALEQELDEEASLMRRTSSNKGL